MQSGKAEGNYHSHRIFPLSAPVIKCYAEAHEAGRKKQQKLSANKRKKANRGKKADVNIYGNFLFHSEAVPPQEMHSQSENIVRFVGLEGKKSEAKQIKQQAGERTRR
jgi:hypothetical protein